MKYTISQDLIDELEEQTSDTESVADRIGKAIYNLKDEAHDCKLESDGHCSCMEGREDSHTYLEEQALDNGEHIEDEDGTHDCETDNSAGNVDDDGTCTCCGKTDLI